MPTIAITKRSVDAAEAKDGRRTIYFDRALPGFGLLVTPAGAKSFVAQYRAGRGRGTPTRRVTIGAYGAWTPEEARAEAKRILGSAAHGADPAAERTEKRRRGNADGALASVVGEWLKRDQAGNRSRAEVERVMRRELISVLGKRPIAEIRKRDLLRLIEAIADRGTPIMANRVLAHTKRLFRWAAGRDLIETDPAAHIEKPGPEIKRDRVLSDEELALVWLAAEALAGPFGAGVQLLIATGARREEIFAARWEEVDRAHACIRLPEARNKVKEPRIIPLSPLAMSVLARVVEAGPFMLSSRGDKPFTNIGHAKAALDAAITKASGEPLWPWRLHDLRRTVATGLQRLGVRLEVIEAVLGHVSGSRAGIIGIYQRHRFEAEAREALAAWGAHVQRCLADKDRLAIVVPLRRA